MVSGRPRQPGGYRSRGVKILTIVGNRPQFIKAAPLSLELRAAGVDEVVVHTGQHWDSEMSAVFFDELWLAEPAYRLDLRTADVDVLSESIADAVLYERPDLVLVYGDTNSTLAGTRAALAAGVPVAHVEAGLRSGDLTMPEEHNRIEVDATAALLLCPDERSREQLRSEGVDGRAEVVGDVMADACRLFVPDRARARAAAASSPGPTSSSRSTARRTWHQPRLRTHRRAASTGSRSRVVFPAHPRTRAAIAAARARARAPRRARRAARLPRLRLRRLQARVIVTDSGGLQKEAYWYGVPCVTARPSTEWVDTVELGANVLVDDDPDALVAAVATARMPAERPVLYGDGHASERDRGARDAVPTG